MSVSTENKLQLPGIGELVSSALETQEGPLVLRGLYMAVIRQFPVSSKDLSYKDSDGPFRALEDVFPANHLIKVRSASGQHLEVCDVRNTDGPIGFRRLVGREIAEDDAWYYTPDQLLVFGGIEPKPVFSDGRGYPFDTVPTIGDDGVASFDLEIVPDVGQLNTDQ